MKQLHKKRLLIVLLLPIACVAIWYLIGVGYIMLCALGVFDFLPVERINIYNKDGIAVTKVLSGATSWDAIEIYQNDSLIYTEDLFVEGDDISIEDVTTTDSIRVIVLEKIPRRHNSQTDSFDIKRRTISLPQESRAFLGE